MGQNGWQMGGTASPQTSLLPMALGIFGSPPLPPSPSVAAGALPGCGPGVWLREHRSEAGSAAKPWLPRFTGAVVQTRLFPLLISKAEI